MTDSPTEAPARLPLSPRARTTATVLVVVAVLLACASSVLGWTVYAHTRDSNAVRDAREAAVSAARQEIINLHTVSYKTIDADFDRVLAGATGKFKEQFSRAREDLKPVLTANQAVTSGTILSAGVVQGDRDSATVLIGMDRTVKDRTDAVGAVNHFRYRLELEKHGGRWLVAQLDEVE